MGVIWNALPAVESYFIDAEYRVEGAWMSGSNYNALDVYDSIADACILWYAYTKNSFPYYGAHFAEFSRIGNTHQYIAHNAGGATAVNGADTFRWVVDYACRDNRFAAYGIFIFKE